jgi:hypothetical protein
VEVLGVEDGRVAKKWDSEVSATEVEFQNSKVENIDVHPEESDYDLLIDGCARHECWNGVEGFLLFSGKTGQTYKAKVVAQELGSTTLTPKYDVTFSAGISARAKQILQDAICRSSAISNKPGLPFDCKAN